MVRIIEDETVVKEMCDALGVTYVSGKTTSIIETVSIRICGTTLVLQRFDLNSWGCAYNDLPTSSLNKLIKLLHKD